MLLILFNSLYNFSHIGNFPTEDEGWLGWLRRIYLAVEEIHDGLGSIAIL
jgi:hypothetical protein